MLTTVLSKLPIVSTAFTNLPVVCERMKGARCTVSSSLSNTDDMSWGWGGEYPKCEMITRYNPSRCLRSSTSLLLAVPHTHNNLGDRAFSHAVLLLWNNLPLDIRIMSSINKFKEALKTHFSLVLCFLIAP